MADQQFNDNKAFFRTLRLDRRRTMLTGKVLDDGSVTLSGAPTNKTWVRDAGDNRRSVPAWGIIPKENVPVIVDVNAANELEIVGVNWVEGTPMFGGALQGVSSPAIQGDIQALNVSAQNINMGRLQPSGAGGLNVQAVGFHTPDGFWRGGDLDASAQGGLDQTANDLDLAGNVPGTIDQVRWVRVYYDPTSNALAAANGTAAVQAISDLDEADVETIAIPAGTYPVGAVALTYGQTDFDTPSQVRFVPARYFLSPNGHLLTGAPAARTIASGVVTVGAESIIIVAAESSTTDDLDTLDFGGSAPRSGWLIADAGDTITIKHGVDNISCFGGADIAVTDADAAVWLYDGTTVFIAGGGGGSGGALDDLTDVDAPSPSDSDVLMYSSSSGNWENAALPTPSGGMGDYVLVRDEKAQNTAGGGFTSGAWRTRDLNTEVVDTGGHASVGSNQITLAAGTYRVRAHAPAWHVGVHQTRLQNITDGTTILVGTSEHAPVPASGVTTQSRSFVEGRFTIAATKVIELQHQCNATKTINGFGVPANFTTEVYSVVELWRE